MSGALDPKAMEAALVRLIGPRQAAAFHLRVASQTGSTNDDVFHLAAEGAAEGTVVFAESQAAGRGRRGDAWISPPGVNLLFSLLLRPAAPVEIWTRLPHLAGLAACRAVEACFPGVPALGLKWPNDIYCDDRKLAGILVESRFPPGGGGVAALGIGLNVNLLPEELPAVLRGRATSVREHIGRSVDRNALAAAVLAEWSVVYPAGLAGDFSAAREELRRRSWLAGRFVEVETGNSRLRGTATGVGPEGELELESAEGERLLIRSAERMECAAIRPGPAT